MTINKLGTLWGYSLADLGKLKSKHRIRVTLVCLFDIVFVAILGYLAYAGNIDNSAPVAIAVVLGLGVNMLAFNNTSDFLDFIKRYGDKELVLEQHYLSGKNIGEMEDYLNSYCFRSVLTADSFVKKLKPDTVLVNCWVLNVKSRKFIIAVGVDIPTGAETENTINTDDINHGSFERKCIDE